jgi:curved DNA-binding protein CbpA
MNYKDAFEILEIDLSQTNYNDISLGYLKEQFRKLALKNHPDKNGNTIESNDKFRQINEAYNYLKREIKFVTPINCKEYEEYDDEYKDVNTSLYFDILKGFVESFFDGNYNEILTNIVKEIVTRGKKLSVKLFDNLEKDTALNIYSFLSNNRSTLHLNAEILEIVRELVVKKYDNIEIYKLNPSINDLLNNNVYKLYINDELFLVPLWYNELYFDGSGCEIIVICEPELTEDIIIDENNNIILKKEIDLQTELKNIITNDLCINIKIGDKEYNIPASNLYMKKEQNYRIKNGGLSKFKKDIYDVTEKADIIVQINIK